MSNWTDIRLDCPAFLHPVSVQSSGTGCLHNIRPHTGYQKRPDIRPISDYRMPVLRSRHIFGRLRLLMAKVPEPTPTYLGRLRLQAKKGGSGSIH